MSDKTLAELQLEVDALKADVTDTVNARASDIEALQMTVRQQAQTIAELQGQIQPPPTGPVVTKLVLVNIATKAEVDLATLTEIRLADYPSGMAVRAEVVNAKSILFGIDGTSHTENSAPFYAQGDSSGVPNAWKPAAGTHLVSATPYANTGASGTAGPKVAVQLPFVDGGIVEPPPPPPPTGDFPNATSTGPTKPNILEKITSDLTIGTAGTVENVDVDGVIHINVSGVTVRNFRAQGVKIANGLSNVSIEDGECGPTDQGLVINGGYASWTASRLHCHHMPGDCFRPGGNCTISDCYVHDLLNPPGAHADAVQCIDVAARNITITGNYFDVSGANSAVFGTYMGWLVQGNYMNGGNYTIQTNGDASVQFINNTFGRDAQYGIVRVGSGDKAALTWTGNHYMDGTPIPHP